MSSLFYPVVTFFLLAVCLSYWAVTAVYPPHQALENIYIFFNVVHVYKLCLLSEHIAHAHANMKMSMAAWS